MDRRSRARVVVAAAVAVFVGAAGWTATQLFGGSGSPAATPRQTVDAVSSGTALGGAGPKQADAAGTGRAFLAAWAARKYDAMQDLVLDPADDMERVYGGLARRLKLTRVVVRPGTFDAAGSRLPFTATLTVAGHAWTYTGAVPLKQTPNGWRVAFTSATVHPHLSNGQALQLATDPAGTRLLDRSGKDLAGDADLEANLLGADGTSGLRRVVGATARNAPVQLVIAEAGTPSPVETLATWRPRGASAGVRTTISLPVQAAAEKAIARIGGGRAALVAIDVDTGGVLALANRPTTGLPAALTPFAPGSTFKIVTAAAVLGEGATASTRVDCPRSTVLSGRTVVNHEHAALGRVTLRTAFAQSCNTAFATLGSRLPAGALERAATQFGFGVDELLPIASPGGSLPPPNGPAQAVEDTIGQGTVTASPLAMAAVAAGVASGTWRQPHVLPCADCVSHAVPHAAELRSLMRAVVTSGTGTAAAAPGGPVYGKTGTAEYGTGSPLPTHAWFVGWQGRIAFAVFAENGSSGGAVAAPAAARFLRALP